MRKSSLIFLLAMAFVMTTVVAAFSAESICKRCDAAKNLGGWSYGLQIDYVTCDPEADQGPYCPNFVKAVIVSRRVFTVS